MREGVGHVLLRTQDGPNFTLFSRFLRPPNNKVNTTNTINFEMTRIHTLNYVCGEV